MKGLFTKIAAALTAVIAAAGVFAFGGCTAKGGGIEIALICAAAGSNDNGYNQTAVNGLKSMADKYGYKTKVVEIGSDLTAGKAIEQMAAAGAKLIFSLEYDFDALIKGVGGQEPLAKRYPGTTFVVFNADPNRNGDGSVIHKNVISVLFNVHEASYLAGYLSVLVNENAAALFDSATHSLNLSGNRSIGFIGGTASDGIYVFSAGYMSGISRAVADLELGAGVRYDYYENNSAGFVDMQAGQTFAKGVYDKGGNIVFACAGNVGAGVTTKASDSKRFGIEVDANKDGDRPGYVLTSVLKNTDVPVKGITEAYRDGTLGRFANLAYYDLASGATGITDLAAAGAAVKQSGLAKWAQIKDKVADIAAKIADGTIKVYDCQRNGYAGFEARQAELIPNVNRISK
ncbi:MAG: BMP family ABC transporter substrate-binding protein [Clostridiales bacterium]|jgi:basic membrane protein A|nr:BMP family ABC transporter substrate-binding protein [Clostridiales bacterium]